MRTVPEDQAAVARQFVELYLQGKPESATLHKHPAAMNSFATPPYASVLTEVAGADTLGRVLVAARATTARGAVHHLEYLVTLELGGSGWQVAAIGSAGR